MNTGDEVSLAWALVDSADAFKRSDFHPWLCTKIGAGDAAGAILDMLTYCAKTDTQLPVELVASVVAWIDGYAATDAASALWRVISQIRASPRPRRGPLTTMTTTTPTKSPRSFGDGGQGA